MKLGEIKVQNFWCLQDATIPLGDTAVLVGANNSGKTALLDALRIALTGNRANRRTLFDEYDYHMSDVGDSPQTSQGIVIELWFREDASDELPAVILQRKDEFISTPFVWLHALLRLANDRQDRQSLEAVCGAFSQLTQVEVDPEEVIAQAQASNLGYLQHWIGIARQKTPDPLAKEALDKVLHDLGAGRDFRAFSAFALAWFDKLLCTQQADSRQTTEVFAGYEDERPVWEELMREILRSLGDDLTLEAFLQELQMRSKEPILRPNTVTLMTIHGAKGKEFDHVYLIGLVEDELPSFQSKRKGDNSLEMEEERRNCFVAITRAIKTLTLSHAERYRGWPKEPSRFLFEMKLLNDQMR